ncbi:enoyl-CoA hydratase domain-containing protein 3, mitochondrial-like [Paramacrobiotus metropolitanus]|uniref:enoyl-CoA hydratase domain-containing protein 3, mitochondrial-like n=1 Tax=Paramacrobiotus metropolitanus TaxID=2943436 RepID=UPI00244586C9|nr:enoyl-CoA hydratase domain-containing protein 3, mitochondrial-like [Paramacrobiotus metropolitanus]
MNTSKVHTNQVFTLSPARCDNYPLSSSMTMFSKSVIRTATVAFRTRLPFHSSIQNGAFTSVPMSVLRCGFATQPVSKTLPSAVSPRSSEHALCLVSSQNGIKRIVLNNPRKRNALSLEMMEEILRHLKDDKDYPRLIVLSANGPVFSSGHDLKELKTDTGKLHHEKVFSTCTLLMCAIEDAPVPVLAVVNGVAAAAGCQLVASCDMVVASKISQFSTPGVSNGLFCSTPSIPLIRAIPKKVAAKMLYTGDSISAQEALQCGLVTSVVEESQLEEETLRIANRICEKSPAVVRLGKEFLNRQRGMDRTAAYRDGERTMLKNLKMDDCQEGISAFFEKRKPSWTS